MNSSSQETKYKQDGMANINFTAANPPMQRIQPWFEKVLQGILVLAFFHAIAVLIIGLDEPLVDLHSFRQTQTALSTYWLAKGGSRLAYETPVVGSPWSIPFEFPLFQYLVALLSHLGTPLDATGRATSFVFFLGGLWPLHMLFRYARLEGPAFLITAILFLTCPLLLYWGRAFLMESCAVFFGLCWLALGVRYIEERSVTVAVAALLAGCASVLVKSTTFPAFAFLGGVLVAVHLLQAWRRGDPWLAFAGLSAMFGLVPFIVGYAWVLFSDAVKSRNDIGRSLTSDALSGWNFGTVAQKLGAVLWVDTVWNRVLADILGSAFLVGIVVLGASLTSRRHLAAVGMSLVAFILPFLLFTNLHIVHNYYQSSNAVFLIAAIGMAMAWIAVTAPRSVTLVLLGTIIVGQSIVFYGQFYPSMLLDGSKSRTYRIAQIAHEHTTAEQSLVVIGDDWSSTIPYYAQRKSLVLPPWAPATMVEKLVADPQSLLGSRPLGAVVYCADQLETYKERAPAILKFVTGRTKLADVDGCELLAPTAEK